MATKAELITQTKTAFATAFVYYMNAATCHWNVEGKEFYLWHKMFEDIYSDTYESIDPFAEHLRAMGTYVPSNLKRIGSLSKLQDITEPLTGPQCVNKLLTDGETLVTVLNTCIVTATELGEQGLINFLADRVDQHQKWNWFLRSSTGE